MLISSRHIPFVWTVIAVLGVYCLLAGERWWCSQFFSGDASGLYWLLLASSGGLSAGMSGVLFGSIATRHLVLRLIRGSAPDMSTLSLALAVMGCFICGILLMEAHYFRTNKHIQKVQVGTNYYYLAYNYSINKTALFYVFECRSNDYWCRRIWSNSFGNMAKPITLVADPLRRELHVLSAQGLEYVYSP